MQEVLSCCLVVDCLAICQLMFSPFRHGTYATPVSHQRRTDKFDYRKFHLYRIVVFARTRMLKFTNYDNVQFAELGARHAVAFVIAVSVARRTSTSHAWMGNSMQLAGSDTYHWKKILKGLIYLSILCDSCMLKQSPTQSQTQMQKQDCMSKTVLHNGLRSKEMPEHHGSRSQIDSDNCVILACYRTSIIQDSIQDLYHS